MSLNKVRLLSHFAVTVEPIKVLPHPNADALELAKVGGYHSIIRKGAFHDNQLVAYIPEQSIIPPSLVPEWVERGILPASALKEASNEEEKEKRGFRVKPIKLRGILSQGLVIPAEPGWEAGQEVQELLGIQKWEPPALENHKESSANGTPKFFVAGSNRCMHYDIENYKRIPEAMIEGEEVVFTEKIHGTWCQVGIMPESLAHEEQGRLIISSKGLAAKGLALRLDYDEGPESFHLKATRDLGIQEKVEQYFKTQLAEGLPVFVLGEVFGSEVQDLGYGAKARSGLGFRVFDIYQGIPGVGRYLDEDELAEACRGLGLNRVPVLFRGPFSEEALLEHTGGKETVSGKSLHIREGVVVRPVKERWHRKLGRVQLKSISEKYLLRSNGTEFH